MNINFKHSDEFEFEVNADLSPAEKQTRDYPGCDASAEINSIYFRGHGLPLNLFTKQEIKCMEREALQIASDRDESAYEAAMEQRADARAGR